MSIRQLAESLFGSSVLDPGLCRCLNGDGEVWHLNTQLSALQPSRLVYYQFGDHSEFRRVEGLFATFRHDRVLTRTEEQQIHLLSIRIFAVYVSVLRALGTAQRILTTQSTINSNLEFWIAQLEDALASMHVIPPRPTAAPCVAPAVHEQDVNEPETEIEPAATTAEDDVYQIHRKQSPYFDHGQWMYRPREANIIADYLAGVASKAVLELKNLDAALTPTEMDVPALFPNGSSSWCHYPTRWKIQK